MPLLYFRGQVREMQTITKKTRCMSRILQTFTYGAVLLIQETINYNYKFLVTCGVDSVTYKIHDPAPLGTGSREDTETPGRIQGTCKKKHGITSKYRENSNRP
jgi:hypothetical protein